MEGTIVRIKCIANGFIVCATDPKIVEANKSPKTPYQNTEVEYSFPTLEKCLKWIKDNADTLVPTPDDDAEYSNSFEEATKDDK